MNPESQRYRLFETVAALLATASRMRPMLLVLDDLHWADKATLLLLRHVMHSARGASLPIIATYRESELGRSHPLADMLITLRREHNVTRLSLRGFDVTTLKALVAHIVGTEAPPQLAQLVADITEGNPFFATEMLRHLKEGGAISRLAGLTGKVVEVSRLGLSEGIKEMEVLEALGTSGRQVALGP
jgi:predicted ATPase